MSNEVNMSLTSSDSNNTTESSSTESSTEDIEDAIIVLTLARIVDNYNFRQNKIPCMNSILRGRAYIEEILNGNPRRSYEMFWMKPHVFRNLCDRLKHISVLEDQRDVSVEEGVAMCLYILSQNARVRAVADRFQHSTATVHWWTKKFLRALVVLGTNIIQLRHRGNQLEVSLFLD
ncbi:hypothetical protein ACFE04_021512 [Oxalis oulophora]